jgi:DNA sulfur modification protein DndD
MIIRRLELRNWGPYAGDHVVNFALPQGRRVIQLVRGENGHGKTHLLRAMVIALHGRDGMRIVDLGHARDRQVLKCISKHSCARL